MGNITNIGYLFMPPLKKGGFCFATVGRSVGRSVSLYTMCCPLNIYWPLQFINTRGCPQWVDDPYWFSRSHVQRSRSNYSSEPSVLSTILIPCLLALDRFCFYREDKPEFCTMGGKDVSETFLVNKNIRPSYILSMFWNSLLTSWFIFTFRHFNCLFI